MEAPLCEFTQVCAARYLFTVVFCHRIDIALDIIEECTRARILFVYILYKSIFGPEKKKRERKKKKREKK